MLKIHEAADLVDSDRYIGEYFQPSIKVYKKEEVDTAIKELVEALECMVEMVEMNGFGKQYAMDVAKGVLAKHQKETPS